MKRVLTPWMSENAESEMSTAGLNAIGENVDPVPAQPILPGAQGSWSQKVVNVRREMKNIRHLPRPVTL